MGFKCMPDEAKFNITSTRLSETGTRFMVLPYTDPQAVECHLW